MHVAATSAALVLKLGAVLLSSRDRRVGSPPMVCRSACRAESHGKKMRGEGRAATTCDLPLAARYGSTAFQRARSQGQLR